MRIAIRQPKFAELAALGDLCMRSKAIWGYDQEFMEACRGELYFNVEDRKSTQIAVAQHGNRLVGVAQVKVADGEANLLKLFVEPKVLRSGLGKLLFTWAANVARDMGAKWLYIEADPSAAAFYRRMGARDIGRTPSGSIPARMLPKLAVDLHATRLAPPRSAHRRRSLAGQLPPAQRSPRKA